MSVASSGAASSSADGSAVAVLAEILRSFGTKGVTLDIFGGWAEEVLGMRPPGPHRDIDLVHRAEDFGRVDALLAEQADRLEEVRAKRFKHKRAFRFRGVLCEILLVRSWTSRPVTLFWGDVEFQWLTPLLHEPAVRLGEATGFVVSEPNLRRFRQRYHQIEPERWRDPASLET